MNLRKKYTQYLSSCPVKILDEYEICHVWVIPKHEEGLKQFLDLLDQEEKKENLVKEVKNLGMFVGICAVTI